MEKKSTRKSCCIIGDNHITSIHIPDICSDLRKEILQAVQDGYTHFILGFDDGVGLAAAEIVSQLKKQNPALTLEAVLPCRSRIKTENPLFHRLLQDCDMVGVCSEGYSPYTAIKRNRMMVALAQRLVAIYNGGGSDEVSAALRTAYANELEIRIIPFEAREKA